MAVDYENLSDEDYFSELKLMFNTTGWEILLIELQELAEQLNDVQACKDPDDLRYRQGQLTILGRILNLEDTLRRAEEDADEAEADHVMDAFNSL